VNLSKEELAVGRVITASWSFFMGIWAIPVIFINGWLWAYGGHMLTDKNWRRIGVPLLTCVMMTIRTKSWLPMVCFFPFYGILTMGYGIPTFVEGWEDDGSSLGRFWWKLLGGKEKHDERLIALAQWHTRLTIGFLIGLSFLPLCLISWVHYLVGVLLVTLMYPYIVEAK